MNAAEKIERQGCAHVLGEGDRAENKSGIKKSTEEEGRQLCDRRLGEQDEAILKNKAKKTRLVITEKKGG